MNFFPLSVVNLSSLKSRQPLFFLLSIKFLFGIVRGPLSLWGILFPPHFLCSCCCLLPLGPDFVGPCRVTLLVLVPLFCVCLLVRV